MILLILACLLVISSSLQNLEINNINVSNLLKIITMLSIICAVIFLLLYRIFEERIRRLEIKIFGRQTTLEEFFRKNK